MDDTLEGQQTEYGVFQFRSSLRQAVIDFIIGSRIRDSGAELGQTTDLGKMIQARVPLHMHGKLDAIFNSWFYFWKVENWRGRTGRSLTHASGNESSVGTVIGRLSLAPGSDDFKRETFDEEKVPNCMSRFFIGCFHQPLDSIEQYFGEKVAFYFTWLQHTASHLVVLSIAGLILFLCQLGSGNVDHPLRPFFAVFIMLWTFVVLLNWKKRANFMA
jgi:hypothetical protein